MPTIQTWNPDKNQYETAALKNMGTFGGSIMGGTLSSFGSPASASQAPIAPYAASGASGGATASTGAPGASYSPFAMPQAPMAPPQVAAPKMPDYMPVPAAGAAVAAPKINPYMVSSAYPTYMKNLGENLAQKSFQTAVNQGIRSGNSAQAYQAALDSRNNNRLQYLAQAGQAQFGIDQSNQSAYNTYQSLLNQQYGITAQQKMAMDQANLQAAGLGVTQRGQNVGLQEAGYQGGITQRGQDIGLLGLGYQGGLTGRGQDMDYASTLARIAASGSGAYANGAAGRGGGGEAGGGAGSPMGGPYQALGSGFPSGIGYRSLESGLVQSKYPSASASGWQGGSSANFEFN